MQLKKKPRTFYDAYTDYACDLSCLKFDRTLNNWEANSKLQMNAYLRKEIMAVSIIFF